MITEENKLEVESKNISSFEEVKSIIYKHRWFFTFYLALVTLTYLNIFICVFLGVPFYYPIFKAAKIVFGCDRLTQKTIDNLAKMPWTAIVTISGSIWFWFLWFIRDQAKEIEIGLRKDEVNINQKAQNRIEAEEIKKSINEAKIKASDFSNDLLQLSAIDDLKYYYDGSIFSDKLMDKLDEYREHIRNFIIELIVATKEKEKSAEKDAPKYVGRYKSIYQKVITSFVAQETVKIFKGIDLPELRFIEKN